METNMDHLRLQVAGMQRKLLVYNVPGRLLIASIAILPERVRANASRSDLADGSGFRVEVVINDVGDQVYDLISELKAIGASNIAALAITFFEA